MALSYPMPYHASSSAQAFWQVGELVAEVMDHLSPTDLYACAVVSKGVSHYALGSLYRADVSFQDILKILAPVHLVSTRQPILKFDEMNFLRSPVSDDWDHFSQYARRVRSLSCISLRINVQIFLDISSVLPAGTLLFPQLHSLEWYSTFPDVMAHLDLFLGDALRDVTISGPPASLPAALEALWRRSPALRRLSVHANSVDEDAVISAAVVRGIMPTLKAFQRLEHLQMHPSLVPAAAVPFLYRLPRLTTLHLRPYLLMTASSLSNSYDSSTLDASENVFQCLKDLVCDVRLLLTGVGASLSAPSIQKLQVALNPTSTEADLDTIARLLRDNCNTLTHVTIVFERPILLPPDSSPITSTVLKSFLGIQSLRCLSIDDVRPARLTCAELEELAPMCSRLSFLVLCARARLNGPASPDSLNFGSLITLAQHCPSLSGLGLGHFVATPPPDLQANPPVFRWLRTLYMDYSTKIEDPAAVAVYLRRLLPPDARLELPPSRFRSATTTAVEAANIKAWKEVSRIFDAMKPLRNIAALHLKN